MMTPDQIKELQDEAKELREQWQAYLDKARRARREWQAAREELAYQRDLQWRARQAKKPRP